MVAYRLGVCKIIIIKKNKVVFILYKLYFDLLVNHNVTNLNENNSQLGLLDEISNTLIRLIN